MPATSPTCATCVHWLSLEAGIGTTDDWKLSDDARPFDERNKPVEGPAWGYCTRVAVIHVNDPATRFYVIDGSDYLAKLGTRSDFGCIEHEQRKEDA
jgi:hypothetical protein